MSITSGFELVDPGFYSQNGPPHDTWTKLRAESPVHWCEVDRIEPFWAITRHADIRFISRQPDKFLSAPGITPRPSDIEMNEREGVGAMRVSVASFRSTSTAAVSPSSGRRPKTVVSTTAGFSTT